MLNKTSEDNRPLEGGNWKLEIVLLRVILL